MKTLIPFCCFLLAFAIARAWTADTAKGLSPIFTSQGRDLAKEERNKELVLDFYNRVFGKRDASVIDKYVSPNYIQHNPAAADGREPLRQFVLSPLPPGTPSSMVISRVIAEGDYVWLHVRVTVGTRQQAIVDIFRVQNNWIVEHFDVIQDMPLTSANPHPMFSDVADQYEAKCEFVRNNTTGI